MSQQLTSVKKRIDWIDVSKFWGMYFVYLGHYAATAGYAFPWVFSFHVPLFFFLSGCVETYNRRGWLENLKQKFFTTLLPFYAFGLLSFMCEAINSNSTLALHNGWLPLLQGGIRNKIPYAGGLWFLSCLFLIQILFSILKLCKHKSLILIGCLGVYLAAEYLIKPHPATMPHWYYNLDSACYYLVFYGLGWFLFPLINRLLEARAIQARIGKAVLTLLCLICSASVFFGHGPFAKVLALHPALHVLLGVAEPMTSIWLVIMVSRYFPGELMKAIGRNSLYMCGNEYIIKSLAPLTLAIVGLPLAVTTPLQAYIYSFILLLVVHKVLVPLEKPILDKLRALSARSTKGGIPENS